MFEIKSFIKEDSGFETYTSKRTGATYKSGKVERELEEVIETAEEYIAIAKI